MRTIIPYAYLDEESWAEDFTPIVDQRQKYMFIQCMGHYKARPGYEVIDRKNLKSFLLLYTSRGTGIVKYLGKEISLTKGYATIIDCTLPHSYFCNPDDIWHFRWIHFSGSCIEGYLSDYMESWGAVKFPADADFFLDIYDIAKKNSPIGILTCSTELIQISSQMLMGIMNNNVSSQKKRSPIVNNAIEIVEEQFQSGLNLDQLCDTLQISKFYFCRIFKEQTGCTPNDYLMTVRLNYAKSLLRSTQFSIEEIALKSGFTTSTYFIQVFKKSEGSTPLQYRKYFISKSD